MTPIPLREWFALPNGDTGGNMRRAMFVALATGAFITSAAALTLGAGGSSSAQAPSPHEYEAARQAIEAARDAALARCESLQGAERDVCRAEASSAGMVRIAEVEQDFRRTHRSARELQRTRIEARYQLERTRCAALGGYKRDKCLIQAHAAKGRALLDAAAPYELRF